MKPKKKSNHNKSTNLIKLHNVKTTEQSEKYQKYNKKKAFVTIQENLQTYENTTEKIYFSQRNSLNNIYKNNYLERMQKNNLSPFSNDGHSVSPKYIRTPDKSNKDQKQLKLTFNIKEQEKKKSQKTKILSARIEKERKKNPKPNSLVTNTNIQIKKKNIANNNIKKKVNRLQYFNQKQERARIQFQNEFLDMMNKRKINKKIAQKTNQNEQDLNNKLEIQLQLSIQIENNQQEKKINKKQVIVKTMKIKVMKMIQRQYPNLQIDEKKLMCSIIIIQRLWRQRKVKMFFQHFVTPKSSPNSSLMQSFQNEEINNNFNTLKILNKKFLKKSQDLIMKQKNKSLIKQGENNFLIRQKSSEQLKQNQQKNLYRKARLKHNYEGIKGFQSQNQKIIPNPDNLDRPSLIKFLQCYREMKLNKPKTKRNVFSLRESLSEKCLMQKYYSNIFTDRPEKDQPKNYQIFSTLKQNQKSIQLFNQINKQQQQSLGEMGQLNKTQQAKSNQIQEIWVRNDTNCSQENESEELQRCRSQKIDKAIIVDETQGFSPLSKKMIKEQDQIQQKTEDNLNNCGGVNQKIQKCDPILHIEPSIKSIQKVAENLIQLLMNEFSLEFKAFTDKKCLIKKRKQKKQEKKSRLPGIEINKDLVENYLCTLINCIFQQNRQNILKSLEIFKPELYIKCHRAQSIIYQIFDYDDDYKDQDQQYYWNVVSNESFFKCEQIFQGKYLKINSENQKFKNFLQLTTKIHNRSLSDSFSELLNKALLEINVHPWNFFLKNSKIQKKILFQNDIIAHKKHVSFEELAKMIKQKIMKQGFSRVGSLKKKNQEIQQKKLLKMIHNEYQQQGNEWQLDDQVYELKGELSEYIFQSLITQMEQLLAQFKEEALTKSQNEMFLETNQTLETHIM